MVYGKYVQNSQKEVALQAARCHCAELLDKGHCTSQMFAWMEEETKKAHGEVYC